MEPFDYDAIRARIAELVVEMRPQARAEAWKVYQRAPHALELDELEAIALLGLAQASSKFIQYNESHGWPPDDYRYFAVYCLRRMRGAMLDAMRSQDWVTRSARTRAKLLRASGQDLGLNEQQLAEATGMSVDEVRDTIAAVAARPVSMDAEPHDVPDPGDVEGQAVVSSVLEAAHAALLSQPPEARVLCALRFYHNLSVAEAAAVIGFGKEEDAARLLTDAVLAVHQAMMRAVM